MTDYYILITDAGAALESAAHANGTTVALASFGVCDGGVEFTPDPTLTTFANEVYSGPISSLAVSTDNPAVLVAQCIIPSTSGGYTIRGIALYASDGTLYATGNYPDQQKPAADSGYSASLDIAVQLAVSDTADITLQVTDDSYLTEPQADTLYLRQDQNLGEIADAGAGAQSESRGHLGLGDIATHDAKDFIPTSGGEIDGNLAISGSLNVGGVTTAQSLTAEGAVELCNYAVSTSRATDNALIQCFDFAGVVAYGYGYYENKFCVASYNDDGSFNKIILSVDKDGNMNIPGTLYTDVDVVSSYLTVTTQNVTLEQKINNEIEAVRNIAFELQCKQLIGNVTPEETQYMTALATYVSTLRNNPDQPRPQLEV